MCVCRSLGLPVLAIVFSRANWSKAVGCEGQAVLVAFVQFCQWLQKKFSNLTMVSNNAFLFDSINFCFMKFETCFITINFYNHCVIIFGMSFLTSVTIFVMRHNFCGDTKHGPLHILPTYCHLGISSLWFYLKFSSFVGLYPPPGMTQLLLS